MLLLILALAPGVANAIPIDLTGTHWRIADSPQNAALSYSWLSKALNDAKPVAEKDPRITGRIMGVLTKTVTFSNLSTITTTFEQITKSDKDPGFTAGTQEFGLRFIMDEKIKNMTDFNWAGFVEALDSIDSIDAEAPNGLHPNAPHFHPDDKTTVAGKTGFDVSPFTKVRDKGGALSDTYLESVVTLDGLTKLELSGGMFAKGDQKDWKGIGIHNWEAKAVAGDDKLRSFKLTQTPVPEPTTLLLFGSGLAGLCIAARLRRRRK